MQTNNTFSMLLLLLNAIYQTFIRLDAQSVPHFLEKVNCMMSLSIEYVCQNNM